MSIVGLELEELKRFKGKKVFTTKAARQFVDELFYAVSKNDLEKISDSIKKRYHKISSLFHLCEIIYFKNIYYIR